MQALPTIPTDVPSPLESTPPPEENRKADTKPEAAAETESADSPFELDPSNVIPIDLTDAGPRPQPEQPWVQAVVHWNDHIVIDRYGPSLRTDHCCECNAKADRTIEKNFSSLGGNTLVRALAVPILRLRERRSGTPDKHRVPVEFGMCRRCSNRRMVRLSLGLAGLISSASFFVQALISGGLPGILWLVVGLALLFAGGFATITAIRLGTPKRIDNRWIILKAGGAKFRESLTQSSIPQF